MIQRLANYIRAGYSGIYLVTHEENRAELTISSAMRELPQTDGSGNPHDWSLHAWSCVTGRIDVTRNKQFSDEESPLAILDAVASQPPDSVFVLRDYHMFLADPNPVLFRKLKETLLLAQSQHKTILILAPRLNLPPELEKLFVVLDFTLPDREELTALATSIAAQNGRDLPDPIDPIIDAARGLTFPEAADAFALSFVESNGFDPDVILREKCNQVRKTGILEVVESKIDLQDIGGLEHLKAELDAKRHCFSKDARDYGLPSPRGVFLVGQPGTGKSLSALATRAIFGIPLLRLDAGSLFGSHVGESEGNWRTAFGVARAISPCILWLDEADGLFAGAKSSGSTDGGTTARVVKSILQDLQYNAEGIFFVMTANDIDGCPDPLIDRLDVWSVEPPTQAEREQIIRIHIAKRRRDPKAFNLRDIAKATEGFSGRQIEQVWLAAMTTAFNDNRREPTTADFLAAAKAVTPTSQIMAEAIQARRKRLQGRARPAGQDGKELLATPTPATRSIRKVA